jgi:hypothetical protein
LKLAVGEGGARAEVLPRASVNFASALGTDWICKYNSDNYRFSVSRHFM